MNPRRITAALLAILVLVAALASAQPKKRIAVSRSRILRLRHWCCRHAGNRSCQNKKVYGH